MMLVNITKKLSKVLLLSILAIIGYALFKGDDPIVVVKGNFEYKPIPFELEATNDIVCKMLIRSYEGSTQAITQNGDTYFFNDVGCMMTWHQNQPHQKKIRLWVYTNDTHRWIDAKIAHYSTTNKTTLGYGFGAYEASRKGYIDYAQMQQRMAQEEHLLNPKVRKRLFEGRYD